MKLHQDISANTLLVTHYDANSISVNRTPQTAHFILTPQRIVPWQVDGFVNLRGEDMQAIVDLKPELMILSTGLQQRFPRQEILRLLINAHIGWEVMDLGSACRTYNILAGEGRQVAAAFLFS